ncbi:MAG: 4Fe-4S dicluster domain-containing protein [Mobilitalea sp.]
MDLVKVVKEAGVVGAGGAGFPTHIKLNTKAECFIINAAECEPLIETDKFLCRKFPDELIQSILVVSEHLGARRKVITLKAKYTDEIACLKKAIAKAAADIEIFEMKTFYPAGDEQVIVQQVCKKSVPERGIPIDVGVVVSNVGTLLNIAEAIAGIPVTEKYLSVVGEVEKPIMVKVPIGTKISECIAKAKVKIPAYAIILGGPMMGVVIEDREAIGAAVVTKTTGNIMILPPDHFLIKWNRVSFHRMELQARSACIQCRMCTDLCPRYQIGHNVNPHMVMRNIWREAFITDEEEYKKVFGSAVNCCECGICERFACPMGLSPCRVNHHMKKLLREKGIIVERNMTPEARESVDTQKVPTDRLIARLGLSSYMIPHSNIAQTAGNQNSEQECYDIQPDEVFILFSQHIGMPALPIVKVGDRVKCGDLIAAANEKGLSANIHASMEGIITDITNLGARISRKEE